MAVTRWCGIEGDRHGEVVVDGAGGRVRGPGSARARNRCKRWSRTGGGSRKRCTRNNARREASAPIRVRSISPVPGAAAPARRRSAGAARRPSAGFAYRARRASGSGDRQRGPQCAAVAQYRRRGRDPARARRRLAEGVARWPGGRRYIANIAGRGYAFVGEVVATDEPDPTAIAAPEPMPPLSMARLFGRAEVVETLSIRLAQQRLITITGPGG